MAHVQPQGKGYRAVSLLTVLNTRLPETTSGGFFFIYKRGSNMNKLITTTAVLALLATTAQAEDFRPYVGADFQRTHVNYADDSIGGVPFNWGEGLGSNLNGANIHVGSRIGQHFGVELGYFRTGEESKTFDILPATPLTSKLRLQGASLDGMGYI
jgi:hypothetical protein